MSRTLRGGGCGRGRGLAALLAAFLCTCLVATPTQAATLDDLLKQVRESAQQTSQANREREARFLREKSRQGELLAQAQSELAAVEARVGSVRARYEANQAAIAGAKTQLAARAGEFTQVVTVARQFAGDLRPVLAESYVGAQFPKRLAVLDAVANTSALPSINQLEALWFTLQQELVEQGRSARFRAPVVSPEGQAAEAEVVRVGAFIAFAGDAYLTVPQGGGPLRALSRQPSRSERRLAAAFGESREAGAVAPILVDPTRGGILALQVERPTLGERIEQGGWPGYVILVVGAVGTALALYQLFYLLVVGRQVERQLRTPQQPKRDNPLGRVLTVFENDAEEHDPEILELRLSEAVLRETPKIERFQPLIRLVIAAGPLLGLLGTVAGMLETFQVILEAGAGDPRVMAGGISQAMIATVLGLGIAIPLLFINAWLSSRSRAIVQVLDEQSAGLLAERLEAQRQPPAAPMPLEPARA